MCVAVMPMGCRSFMRRLRPKCKPRERPSRSTATLSTPSWMEMSLPWRSGLKGRLVGWFRSEPSFGTKMWSNSFYCYCTRMWNSSSHKKKESLPSLKTSATDGCNLLAPVKSLALLPPNCSCYIPVCFFFYCYSYI